MSFARNILLVVLFGIVFVLPTSIATAVTSGCNDNDPNTVCDIFDKTCTTNPDVAGCQDRDQSPEKNSLYGSDGVLTKATRLVAILVGIASVIMIMIGGFKYVVSSGDSASVNSAKNTILYAVIGLVVSLIAQAIVLLVVNGL